MNDHAPPPPADAMLDACASGRRLSVLVVDDTAANLSLLAQVLAPEYQVKIALSGARALQLAAAQAPDLIVLDVMMPGLDGFEVCRRLKADPALADVPVLFLTALTKPEHEAEGFAAGGADFIHKPFNPETVRARVRTQLQLKVARDVLHDRNAHLSRELECRRREAERLRETTLFLILGLAEFRDEATGNHVKRTEEYVRVLAGWYAAQVPAAQLTPEAVEDMAKAAPLHDIGKVAIRDAVLLKPGALSAEEWVVMKTHTVHGGDLLQRALDHLGTDAGAMLVYARQIARHHHERWDGSGYPDGLAGEAIPLAARLMAVADVYDALISRRPYKQPLSHAEAMATIRDGAGRHFDPLLVDGLQACAARFAEIATRLQD
ncbi:two-component system response regulator [Rubrivivax gelatinosus]|nr:two-component system response regulator [Rubrivivax gelatinosus]